MKTIQDISELIQYHNGIDYFNYDLVVDWAIDLIERGIETDNILILASFSKPVDSDEIKPHLRAVLKELKLVEKNGDEAVFALIHFYLSKILNNINIRSYLTTLYHLYIRKDSFYNNDKFGLMPFYLLYHGWRELEEIGANYYFEGADFNNIEEVIKEQARIWINTYIKNL